jgi:hypothetical protein
LQGLTHAQEAGGAYTVTENKKTRIKKGIIYESEKL